MATVYDPFDPDYLDARQQDVTSAPWGSANSTVRFPWNWQPTHAARTS